ncbi:MAG TPA: flavodoxin family protein [Chloroflexota bacterium]|nr:flavodoxin family protein [Chloroflexota bacterium]
MNATFWIVGEIIVGIAVLGVLSAVVTAVMVPFLDRVRPMPLRRSAMKSTVVYESHHGNTARIARAIAHGLEAAGPVRLAEASDPTAFEVAGVDLLVVGGPTEGHGVSQTLRPILNALPPNALKGASLATFDTRLTWPAFLAGSAAHGIAKILQAKGARLVIAPESFLVTGMKEVHLVEGEVERVGGWAERLLAKATESLPQAG